MKCCNDVYEQKPIDYWARGCILPFPKKGDLGKAENYRGITLTSIADFTKIKKKKKLQPNVVE